jgi:hypothetical protein
MEEKEFMCKLILYTNKAKDLDEATKLFEGLLIQIRNECEFKATVDVLEIKEND